MRARCRRESERRIRVAAAESERCVLVCWSARVAKHASRLVRWRALVLVAAAAAAATVVAAPGAWAQALPIGASTEVRDAQGRLLATAQFRDGRSEVLIAILFPS